MTQQLTSEGGSLDVPLLELEGARVHYRGALGPPMSVKSEGGLVVLLGDFSAVFGLLAREAELHAGTARTLGENAETAVSSGTIGLARFDAAIPLEWTPERYLTESGRLLGLNQREAARVTDEALTRFELSREARRKLSDLTLPLRRVLLLAHATLGAPRALAVENPFGAADHATQAYLAAALERATGGRPLLVSVQSAKPEGQERMLIERASSLIVERGGRVALESALDDSIAPGARYSALVTRSGEAFARALSEAGIRSVRAEVSNSVLGFTPRDPAGIARYLLELPSGKSPSDVVKAAHEASAPLVELVRES
jgi:hypothetical protein